MKITLDFDPDNLTYTDSFLAALWHAAQWNSAPSDDPEACRLAERIGREIIRRWLANTPPELWHRQGSHEKSLPVIHQNADVQNVLNAARTLVNADLGAPLPYPREDVEDLSKALRKALAQMEEAMVQRVAKICPCES